MKSRAQWRRRRGAVPVSTVAFAIIIAIMVALVAYATYLNQAASSLQCTSTGATSSSPSAVKVGFVTELSGSSVSNGYAARIAAELAVNHTNAAGGVDGKQIDLVILDSRTNPQAAAQCASILDQQDGVLAITGPTDQGDAVAVESYAESHGVPFVISAISSATLSSADLNWTVSVEPDAVQWGAAVAKYVSQAIPGAKVAMMTQNAEQQREMAAGVRWYADTYKNESVVFDQLYANAQFPWATAAAAAKASGANAVVISWISTSGFSESNVIEALLSAGFQQNQIFVVSATADVNALGTNGAGIRGGALFEGAMAQGNPNASDFVSQLQPFVNGALQSPEYCGVCPTDVGPVYYYSYIGMEMMINSMQKALSSSHALTRASFMSSMKHATIRDVFGSTLKVGAAGPSLGSYYIVQVGELNATASTYPLHIIASVEFSPGTVPAYRLAKTA